MNESNYVYEFCKEIIRLFKEGDDHYLLCCNFMKALALYITEFYRNLPSWLLNLESNLPFINNRNNDGLYLIYVQSLMENSILNLSNELLDENEADAAIEYFLQRPYSRRY